MQEAPGRMRAATWGQICRKKGSDSHHQRFPSPDVHQEDQDQGGGQLDQSDGDEAGFGDCERFCQKTRIPGVGVLGQVDLVCTERWSVLPEQGIANLNVRP